MGEGFIESVHVLAWPYLNNPDLKVSEALYVQHFRGILEKLQKVKF